MLKLRWTCAFMVLGLLVAMPSFAAEPLETMISKGDHQGLQRYYSQQAQEFKAKANYWDTVAEFYERHPGEPTGDRTRAATHSSLPSHFGNLEEGCARGSESGHRTL